MSVSMASGSSVEGSLADGSTVATSEGSAITSPRGFVGHSASLRWIFEIDEWFGEVTGEDVRGNGGSPRRNLG